MLPKACDRRFVLRITESNWPHLLVELGVEKRSITGTELMVPPAVETGDESVVATAGFLWSSFTRCSWNYIIF